MRRALLGVLCVPLVLIGAFVLWLFYGHIAVGWWLSTDFDSGKWQVGAAARYGEHSEWPIRLRMVEDLMDSGMLDGLSRTEVIGLLGTPQEPGPDYGWSEADMHYWLGPQPGFMGLDDQWLFVEFDDQNRVKSYQVFQD